MGLKDRLHIGSSHLPDVETPKDTLVVTHNAGFFSCNSIALQDIMIYYNEHGKLPDFVDRTSQYAFYKAKATDNLIPFYYAPDKPFSYDYQRYITHEGDPQFTNYSKLLFDELKPFLDAYFTPSDEVLDRVKLLEKSYNIDYENTCAVFYRGNDKARETKIAPYEDFWRQISRLPNNIKLLVQPDECEFWEQTSYNFSHRNPFKFSETPCIPKQDSAVFFELPQHERAEAACWFLAATLVISKCKYIITHSGNCSLWAILYRGNTNGVKQYLNGKWLG